MAKPSFTNPQRKVKGQPRQASANSVMFDILKNLAIEIWTQSKLMEYELLSIIAVNKILNKLDSKLNYKKP